MKKDAGMFETLVITHYAQIYGTILSKVNDPATTDELTQNTFCQAWAKLDQLQHPEAARGWLQTIAENQVKMYYRALQTQKRSRFKTMPLGEEMAEKLATTEDEGLQRLLARDMDRDLQFALARLDPLCRHVVWLRAVEGLSFVGIGRALHVTAAVANRQYRRGLKQLRIACAQHGRQVAGA